jgi:diphosphomevalonate decarboxylase
MDTKKTARAPSNIALVKYWGKRNESLILPQNSSVSMTLDNLYTITTVEFDKSYKEDEVYIDDLKATKTESKRVIDHLELLRTQANVDLKAKVVSKGNFPKKAGLASSASAFAALTLAASEVLGLSLTEKELSIFSRRGSGSAARSINGGFVKWNKGQKDDGSDSYATSLVGPDHWPELAMIVTVVSPQEKKVSSRAGMKQTVQTSPLYESWLNTIESDIKKIQEAILEKDFQKLGTTAEKNALKMHASMHTTTPPLIYWESGTLKLMKEVISLREEGTECYFTIDAGPQVKVLCLKKDLSKISERITSLGVTQDIYVCHPGNGASIINNHLF